MRAFKIQVNGEQLCLARVSDGVLSTIVHYVNRDSGRPHLDVGGLLTPQEEHVKWLDQDLALGDEIRVTVVESETVDPPKRRYPARDPKKEIRSQKEYVRAMARKFGWKIQTGRKGR